MDRNLKVFRFCRQSRTALPVFLAFISCDKLLPPSSNGVDIPVKIRAVNIAGGAQNKTVTRASSSERGMVGQPVIRDLGGGMLAEISVEEDFSALRDDPVSQALDKGAKFRVFALKTDGTYYAHADFTVGGNSNYTSPDLHVQLNEPYDFVCFSYNSSSESLPDDASYEVSNALPVVAANVGKTFYYQKKRVTITNVETDLLSFLMKPQFVKVKLKLDANTNASRTITNIANDAIHMNVPTSGSFNLAEGTFSGSGSIDFTGWSIENDGTATSGEFTFLPKTTDYTLAFDKNAARAEEINNGTIERSFGPGSISVPYSQFKAGYSYTIGLKRYRIPRFAGSNIYWDGSKLTFDPHGSNANTRYQGVYFRWGSLIGISPVGDYSSSSTVLYKPTNTSDPVGASRTWVETTGSDNAWTGNDWADIPYYTAESDYGKGEKTLLENPDFEHYVGDICNYIDENYRMPTGLEFDTIRTASAYSSTNGGFAHDDTDMPDSSPDDIAGKYRFKTNYGTLTCLVLPASGHRKYDTAALGSVGNYGDYWCGSAYSSGNAYDLTFGGSGGASTNGSYRSSGELVRCVLN
jgi:hypothetical protein